MYFSQNYTVKWHDTDAEGRIRPSAVLTYMQETAMIQCRAYGCDLDTLRKERGQGFLLSRLQIRFLSPVQPYSDIEVRTYCPPSAGYTFLRYFTVYADGAPVSHALSTWALADISSRRFVRVSESSMRFPEYPEAADIPLPPPVRSVPDIPFSDCGVRRIQYNDCDVNFHMNNTRYPDMISDYLPDGKRDLVRGMSMVFRRELSFGEEYPVMRGYLSPDDPQSDIFIRIRHPDGDPAFDARVIFSEASLS